MAYISVDSIAECVLALGRDALLAKSDVKRLQADSGASRRSRAAGDSLERAVFRGRDSPVRSALGP